MKELTVLSLFNGMSVGMIALKNLNVPIKAYYSSEIDKHAIAESQINFPEIIQLGDVTKWKEWDIDWSSIDLLMGGFPCFPEGTMVMTDKGHKDIKDIEIGDMVLTHTGNYRKVLDKGEKYAPTRIISGQGHFPIECTDEHPFYTKTQKKLWDKNRKKHIRTFSEPSWVDAKTLSSNHFLCNVKSISNNNKSYDENFWYFMGRFMGDGWTYKVKRKNRKNSYQYRVFICCSLNEFDELVSCFDKMGMKYNYVKEKTVYKFYICSKELVEFCDEMGKGASNKKPHPLIFTEQIEHQESFLRGYFDADGHFNSSDGSRKFTSTSVVGLMGIQQLIMNVYNRNSNITVYTPCSTKNIQGRVVNQKKYAVLQFFEKTTHSEAYSEEIYSWVKGVKINESTGEWKTVYNIEVDVDNTYTANNIVVHNCQAWSNAGTHGGVNDIRGQLFLTMVDIYKHIKSLNPNLKYLFENVKMKEDFKEFINTTLDMSPVLINSQHYTAHYRQRYYWTSTDTLIVPPPLKTSPTLQSVLECGYTDRIKSYCIDANYFKGGDLNQYFNKSRRQVVFMDSDIDRDNLLEHGKRRVDYRHLTPVECCRLQGVPDDYFKVSSKTQQYKMLGNGWTVPVIEHLLREILK